MQNCWSSAPAFSLIKALSQWSSLEETYTKTIQKLVWFVILSNVISLCINGNFTVIFSLPFFFLSSFLFSSLYRKRNCINVKTKWERKWQKLMVKTKQNYKKTGIGVGRKHAFMRPWHYLSVWVDSVPVILKA